MATEKKVWFWKWEQPTDAKDLRADPFLEMKLDLVSFIH